MKLISPFLDKEREKLPASAEQKVAQAYNRAYSKLPLEEAWRIFNSFPERVREKTYDHLSLMYHPSVEGRRSAGLDERGKKLQEKLREKSELNAQQVRTELAAEFSRESIQETYEEVLRSSHITINVGMANMQAILESGREKVVLKKAQEGTRVTLTSGSRQKNVSAFEMINSIRTLQLSMERLLGAATKTVLEPQYTMET